MTNREGVLLILSGPSGAGKGTICKELLRRCPELAYSVSATTREPRTGEEDGVNYLFTRFERFEEMIRQDELLEWAKVYDNYYGTPRAFVENLLRQGKDVILEIDTQGALQIKNKFPQGVFVYIIPPSLEELANRIRKRGTDSTEVIEKRLGCVLNELAQVHQYQYIVVNDKIESAVTKIQSIIAAEHCHVQRNQSLIDDIHKLGYIR